MGCGPTPVNTVDTESAAPNILIIDIDSLRSDRVELDSDGKTIAPNLMSLASEGVRFSSVEVPSGSALASFVTLLAGRTPPQVVRASNEGQLEDLAGDHLLPSIFGARGYAIGIARGAADQARAKTRQEWFGGPGSDDLKDIDAYTRLIATGLKEPFFHVISDMDLHVLEDPDEAFGEVDPRDSRDTQVIHQQWLTQQYDNRLQGYDAKVGALLAAVKKAGLRKSTIIVVATNRGEELADHGVGITSKAKLLYKTVSMVPLIISAPSMPGRGDVIDAPIQLRDLAPTLLELAELPIHPKMTGTSLVPSLKAPASPLPMRETYMSTFQQAAAVRSGFHKLIYQPVGCEPNERMPLPPLTGSVCELVFDLSQDPDERNNIAKNNPGLTTSLRQRLLAFLQLQNASNPEQYDRDFREGVRRAGYWQAATTSADIALVEPEPSPPKRMKIERVDSRSIVVSKRVVPQVVIADGSETSEEALSCRIKFEVDPQGVPTDVQPVVCDERYTSTVLSAAKEWRFLPWFVDDTATAFKVVKTIPVEPLTP